MLLDFYELREQPFGVTPDPRFLYLGASHREALASLCYGVKMSRGLVALVAPPGMGKTTLLFRLLEHLKLSARTAFLFQTQCDSNGLLHYILNDLGINTRGQNFIGMHQQLNSLLVEEARAGRRFVVVIDEAQNLAEDVLETARLLTDFETPGQKLLQIVLSGQPQLADKLKRPELVQLRQRISTVARLGALRLHEVNDYINHRLQVASCAATPIFTPSAVCKIYAASEGIPRNINNLCFNAMSLGYALRAKKIDADLISEAVSDLDLELPSDPWFRPLPSTQNMPASDESCVVWTDRLPSVTTEPSASQPDVSSLQLHGDRSEVASSQESQRNENLGVPYPYETELVLERLELAVARDAEILAEVIDVSHQGEIEHAAHMFEANVVSTAVPAPSSSLPVGHDNTDVAIVESPRLDIPARKPRKRFVNSFSAAWKATRRRFALSAALLMVSLAGFYYRTEIGMAANEIREIVTGRTLHIVAFTGSIITPPKSPEKQNRNADVEQTPSDPVSRRP